MKKSKVPGNEKDTLEKSLGVIIPFPKSNEYKARKNLRSLEEQIRLNPENFPIYIPDSCISAMIFFNSYEYGIQSDSFTVNSFNKILTRSLDYLQYLIDIDEIDKIRRFDPQLYDSKNKRKHHSIGLNKDMIEHLKSETHLLEVQIPSVAINLQMEDFTNMLNSRNFFGTYKKIDLAIAEAQFRRDFYLKNILRQLKKGKQLSFVRPESKKFKIELS